MNLYLDSGFIDQQSIYKAALKNGAAYIVEIGARQVGKTYGTLQLILKSKKPFIFMRRTQTEIDLINSGAVNPFTAIDPDVTIKRDTKNTGIILRDDQPIGMTVALSTISKIRGFYAEDYEYLIYDECIPENHVSRMRYEEDAFLNAIVTISGNRELKGKPPLLTWLLANSNNISAAVIRALDIGDKVDQMIRAGQEISILSERGIIIVIPHSEEILEKRRTGAGVAAVNRNSRFYKMAYENQFAYNDYGQVKKQPIIEYKLICSVAERFTVYKHKSKDILYITENAGPGSIGNNANGKRKLFSHFPNIKLYFINDRIFFDKITTKEIFVDFLKT